MQKREKIEPTDVTWVVSKYISIEIGYDACIVLPSSSFTTLFALFYSSFSLFRRVKWRGEPGFQVDTCFNYCQAKGERGKEWRREKNWTRDTRYCALFSIERESFFSIFSFDFIWKVASPNTPFAHGSHGVICDRIWQFLFLSLLLSCRRGLSGETELASLPGEKWNIHSSDTAKVPNMA